MTFKKIGYGAVVAMAAVGLLIGSAGSSQAKSAKKEAAPATPPVFCFQGYAPVCGARGNLKFTYANACWAAKDGAKLVSTKPCPAPKAVKAKKAKKPAKKK